MSVETYRLRDLFTVPGWLSLSRVGLAAYFPFVATDPPWAISLVAVAALSDVLDGYYARRHDLRSPTGAVLDPIADKIFATSVMLSLIASGELPLRSAMLMSTREIGELPLLLWLLSTARARAMHARPVGSNRVGKLTTGLQFAALLSLLVGLPGSTWWLSATACTGALAAGLYWKRWIELVRRQRG